VANGVLHVGQAGGDPNHLLYAGANYAGVVQEILARARVTRFGNGPYARGGIGISVDRSTSQGINFTFRDNDGAGHPGRHLALLDDYREWGPVLNFVWQTNTWYWLRLRQEPDATSQGGANDVFAKIWLADGTVAEPTNWQLTWNYTPARSVRSGYAGVMAGSTAGGPTDYSELDVDYCLVQATGLPVIVVAPGALTSVPVVITNQPRSQTVLELGSATFEVGAGGNPPPSYQWFRDETPLEGETNRSYTVGRARWMDQDAQFKVVAANIISNLTYSVTSAVATLTVIADTTPPALVSADSVGLGALQVKFSEGVEPASATVPAHYSLSGPNGLVQVTDAVLDSSHTKLRLTISPALTEGRFYTLTVNGVVDESARANALVGGSIGFTARQPAVFITELVAENSVGLTDQDGAHSDWIELQNQSPFPVDLAGWQLTDAHATDPPKPDAPWIFPETALAPGQFIVVFASGKDRREAGAELHTNFRLDGDGESLALIRPDGSIAHELTFGPQKKDVSFGLTGGTNLFMLALTPGASNGPGVFGFVADTKFNPNRGFFTNSVTLTITSATLNAEIWVTRDGSLPRPGAAGSTRYTLPLLLSNTTTLRARAFLAGYAPTDVDTHTYLSVASTAKQPANPPGLPPTWCSADGCFAADYGMDAQVVTNTVAGHDLASALRALPAVSLVAPIGDLFGAAGGIYADSLAQGDAYEREASIELIFPDGSAGFQCEAGLRIHGYTSRAHSNTLKHSLRVSFRDRYGPAKLHFPLFPDLDENDFDQLVLRACSTDSYPIVEGGTRWEARRATYLRDQWMRDALRDLGQATAHGRYVHLWINGLYWGLYNLTEALGNGWAAETFGGDKEEYDVIKDYLLVDHGDEQAWDAATVLATTGFASEADYQQIQGRNPDGTLNPQYPVYLNVTNLVDYMIVHILAGAEDWDFNNWWCCRRRGPSSAGFHFCAWDQEISNESLTRELNVFGQRFEEVNTFNRPSYFYDRLRNTSSSFCQFFRDRVWQVLTGHGPLTPAQNAARWRARQNEIDQAIVAESARWGDARHEPPFTREANWLPEMQWVSLYWASNHTRVIERFRRVNLWPTLAPPAPSVDSSYFTNNFLLLLTQTNLSGAIWFTLDDSDPRAVNGAPSATAQPYAAPLSISGLTRLRARVHDGLNWSAPLVALYCPIQALTNLVVSELYYHPPADTAAPGLDGDEFEFVELHNEGNVSLDLSGLAFHAGINFVFSNNTALAPGAYVLLARNATAFAARFPNAPSPFLYTGKLANEGETLTLTHPLGTTVFSFTYNDQAPWPRRADGGGDSLHRLHPGDPQEPGNWCATTPTPGAPAPAACQDADADGLPDAWELQYGFDPHDPSGRNGATGDPDGDGVTNLAEYIAGTDPLDARSYLRIESISAPGPGAGPVRLTFFARANRFYSVQYANSPGGPWTTLHEVDAQPADHEAAIEDIPGVSNRCYRLVTSR
jgi:hypothetical protein